jgi:formate dehydrogenase subunit delta
MNIERLISMANQVGDFFGANPNQVEAKREIAGHLKRFWEPRMRRSLIDHVQNTNGSGLSEVVKNAVAENVTTLS